MKELLVDRGKKRSDFKIEKTVQFVIFCYMRYVFTVKWTERKVEKR